MDMTRARIAFDALSQDTRLAAFRLLIQAGRVGVPAGVLAEKLDVRQNTLSANLSVLLAAGLVSNQREGRSVRYFADMDGLRAILSFLMEDCCGGEPDLCRPVIDAIACPCP